MKNLSATEESVGCRLFANDAQPMSGIIKHKYSDFHVHEIDQKNNIVRLTQTVEIPLAPYPEGYEEWLSSTGKPFFSFKAESDDQIARIYYNQPTFNVTIKNGNQVSVEKAFKKKTRPFFISFVLYKENINQQSAIGKIAQKLGKPKKLIGIAGSKDKRGITTQICTMRDVPPHRFAEATSNLGDNLKISDVRFSMNQVSLGDLSGNRFTIVLRDIKFEPTKTDTSSQTSVKKAIRERVETLKKSGFINYFGMQRFGTSEIPTHYIGILVLKREWRQIIDTLLRPLANEIPRLHDAKAHFASTGDAEAALRMLPHSAQTEYALLEAIARSPKGQLDRSPHEIFSKIDRRQRMMYVHAYQSFLWNHLVSRRIEKHGTNVVEGDLVMLDTSKQNSDDNHNMNDLNDQSIVEINKSNIKNFTIFDVVLPLPSSFNNNFSKNNNNNNNNNNNSKFINNNDENDNKSSYFNSNGFKKITNEFTELMMADGITPDMFEKIASEYGSGGGWRTIMSRAQDIEYEIIRHDDFDAELIDSDRMIIEGLSNRTNHVKNGKFTSLCISFSLGSGMYATMCLRELLKRSTEWYTDSAMSAKNAEPQTHWWQSICNIA